MAHPSQCRLVVSAPNMAVSGRPLGAIWAAYLFVPRPLISSHIFVEASAHLLTVTPTAQLEYLDLASAILVEPHRPVDGTVIAKGPGLGIEWDEGAIARFAMQRR